MSTRWVLFLLVELVQSIPPGQNPGIFLGCEKQHNNASCQRKWALIYTLAPAARRHTPWKYAVSSPRVEFPHSRPVFTSPQSPSPFTGPRMGEGEAQHTPGLASRQHPKPQSLRRSGPWGGLTHQSRSGRHQSQTHMISRDQAILTPTLPPN